MLLQPPSLALSQLFTFLCRFINCDATYPSPVSLLPEGFRTGRNSGINANLERQSRSKSSFSELNESVINEIEDRLPPIVHTKLGVVQGYFMTVISGRKVYAFEGIPYAEPPVGNNRFRAPQPKSRWRGTLETMDPGPICIQLNVGRLQGKEDCLRLNIYTPKLASNNFKPKLPIIIYIHGGGFIFGSGSWFGPAYLLEQDIILVTFNFRLGILGSMTTGDEVASGNFGLKDQAMVINWIYENIEPFGGDRKRITLVGQSSGAMSTHLQMLSPLAQDKIFSAISLSGGAYNFWGLNSLAQAKDVSLANAVIANCPIYGGNHAMINCMRKMDAELLVANQLLTISSGLPVAFIEANVSGAFITESPDAIYATGKVAKIPWVTTVTSNEASVVLTRLEAGGGLPFLRLIFNAEANVLLGLNRKVSLNKAFEIIRRVKEFYGVGQNDVVIPRKFFSEVGSDRFFNTAFHKAVQMHSQIAPTYAGIFSYANNLGYAAQSGLDPKEYGVGHNEDLIFFLNSTSHQPISRKDYNFAITKLLVNVYTNFAETGEPSFLAEDDKMYKFWEATRNPEELKFLTIGEEVKMIGDPFKNSSNFWESLGIPDTTSYLKL